MDWYFNNFFGNPTLITIILPIILATGIAIMAFGTALAQIPSAYDNNATAISSTNMSLESAREQYMLAWNQTRFNATFSTFIEPHSATGFGVYKEHVNVFRPGETIVLYVEPVGYGYKLLADDQGHTLYLMNMTADYAIADSNDTVLQTIKNVPVGSIVSHRTNTELFLELTLTQQRPFPIGDYLIRYTITDQVSGQSFHLEKQIRINGASMSA
jgi:hypothetical protein